MSRRPKRTTAPSGPIRDTPLPGDAEAHDGFRGQRMAVLPADVVERMRRAPLFTSLLPTDIGYFPQATAHCITRKQAINQAIFIHCTKGGGWCDIGKERHCIEANNLLVVPPNEPHAYGADPQHPWTIFWFHVTGTDVPLLLHELGVSAAHPVTYLGEDSAIMAVFQEAMETLEAGYAPSQLLHASRVLGYLISLMIRRVRENWRDQPDIKQKMSYCINYLNQHIDKPLRLGTIAQLSNLSPSHFNLAFRKETGYTCMEYLAQVRIHRACQWLDATDWPIKTIATRAGFDDPLYFSRVFKAVRGMSPRQYRRLHKG